MTSPTRAIESMAAEIAPQIPSQNSELTKRATQLVDEIFAEVLSDRTSVLREKTLSEWNDRVGELGIDEKKSEPSDSDTRASSIGSEEELLTRKDLKELRKGPFTPPSPTVQPKQGQSLNWKRVAAWAGPSLVLVSALSFQAGRSLAGCERSDYCWI